MKLVKNYLYNVLNQLFILFVPLVTIPYVSRVIGPDGVGINAFTNSIVSYFVLFGSIGISLYGNRTIAYVREDKMQLSKTFWEIQILRLITTTISFLCFLLFLIKYKNGYHPYLLGQSILIIAAGLDISWFFMGQEDFKKTVVRNIIVKLVSLMCIFIFVKSEKDLLLYILILTISQLIGNITLWGYLKQNLIKIRIKDLNIFKHFVPSFQLFIPQVAIQVYLVLNKTMLGEMYSVDSVGFYDNADKIIRMLLAVVTATGTVMLPRVANVFSKGNMKQVEKYLITSFDFVCSLSFPLSLGIMGVARNFSSLFFGNEFSGIDFVLMGLSPIVIAISMSNVIGQQYLLPTNKMKEYTLSVFCGACSNLLINLYTIPYYGAIGAAISTVVSEFVVTIIQMFFIRNDINIKCLFKGLWKYFISSVIMFIMILFVGKISNGFFGLILQIIVGMSGYIVACIILNVRIVKIIKRIVIK